MKENKLLNRILPNYKVNKVLMNITLLIILILVIGTWSIYDFTNPFEPSVFYVECPENYEKCENPLWWDCNSESFESDIINNEICSIVNSELYENRFLQGGEYILCNLYAVCLCCRS